MYRDDHAAAIARMEGLERRNEELERENCELRRRLAEDPPDEFGKAVRRLIEQDKEHERLLSLMIGDRRASRFGPKMKAAAGAVLSALVLFVVAVLAHMAGLDR